MISIDYYIQKSCFFLPYVDYFFLNNSVLHIRVAPFFVIAMIGYSALFYFLLHSKHVNWNGFSIKNLYILRFYF